MVSLPSGFREGVELVVIETKDFSLVIKGSPYHEMYEGLKQYRAMDTLDEMEFSVCGVGVDTIWVYDVNQQKLTDSILNLRPIFFENGIYQILAIPKTEMELEFYHEHPGFRKAISSLNIGSGFILMGNLHFQNEIGYSSFEIRSQGLTLLDVTLEVFPTKLDYKRDYYNLLEEVNNEIYNLSYSLIKKTYLRAKPKLDGDPAAAEFYRLIRHHFDNFLKSIKKIEQQPNHQLQKHYVKARGDQLRKLDSRTRSYLRKRPTLFVEADKGIHVQSRTLMPKEGMQIKKDLTFDTIENRFVKHMMARLNDKLNDLILRLRKRRRWSNEEKPNSDLLQQIEFMANQLEKKMKNRFWKGIGKLNRSVFSLVLQMAPGYRDAYQIFLTVSKGLMVSDSLYRMSMKDVASLYEYWTFLKLGHILAEKYELVSQDIIKVNREGLFVNLGSNQSSQRVFRHPVTKERITLTYQKYEGNLPTLPQKPDTMLSIEKMGRDYCYHYVFDAKYRIDYAQGGSSYQSRYLTPGPLEEDINTMHRYRDSIVAKNEGPFERVAFGAYVLFPWFDEDNYQEHHFYESINKVNIGALPFLPNANSLVEKFVERLIESSPEELQKEGILPKGTKEQWFSELDEKVLVGLVSSQEEYRTYVQEGYYEIPVSLLKKGWQEAEYVALFVKKGVGDLNGVKVYGRVDQIIHVGKDDGQYARFNVDGWHDLERTISPVHYGISSYIMTTLQLIKKAKELPELFMKSEYEMLLWRMLRRVSERVEVKLDEVELDDATRVDSFAFDDIEVDIVNEEEIIIFKKRNEKMKVEVKDLKRQPSRVFMQLIEFMK
ncbi:DUF2357 domain-containing protein [[Bacillus] enclensis]|uniref:DUF2357 domain-containing protein n=1 Tax=[Bacillus] enclensis TaxID=1402860 RepID=UPI0018DC55EE|nr:restriction endonuclease-like protein [[Bacillus] enclensis]MBH9966123.1 restriction endonuclease-like protein [[Bacillus] enclensis]